jgi:hypothetical protein
VIPPESQTESLLPTAIPRVLELETLSCVLIYSSASGMELAKASLILAQQLALEWASVASLSVSDVWLKSQHQQLRTRSLESEAIS